MMTKYLRRSFILFCCLSMVYLGKTVESSPHIQSDSKEIMIEGLGLSTYDLAFLSRKEIENKMGIKLKFKERIAFVMVKKEIRRGLKEGKSLEELEEEFVAGVGIHWGGFLLGLFLTVIGVLIAHLIFDKGSRGRKWAWFGGIISVVILGTALII